VVSEGDWVVGDGRVSGTNTGNFFGMPPTGKTAEFGYLDMYRIDSAVSSRPGTSRTSLA
jgi:predicted ester cyclase